MSKSFNKAIKHTLKMEGGWINHKNDPGGATNWGISLRFLRQTGDLKIGDIDGDGDIDANDIKHMSSDQAENIYYKYFWKPYEYDSIKSEDIAGKVFDMTVNMGPRQSHKIVQESVNEVGGNLVVDGVIGQNTIRSINSQDPDLLLSEIRLNQADFYRRLVEQKPKLKSFIRGWLRRAAL